jgi:hypothetical protein
MAVLNKGDGPKAVVFNAMVSAELSGERRVTEWVWGQSAYVL